LIEQTPLRTDSKTMYRQWLIIMNSLRTAHKASIICILVSWCFKVQWWCLFIGNISNSVVIHFQAFIKISNVYDHVKSGLLNFGYVVQETAKGGLAIQRGCLGDPLPSFFLGQFAVWTGAFALWFYLITLFFNPLLEPTIWNFKK
jgi:hypothetical protein